MAKCIHNASRVGDGSVLALGVRVAGLMMLVAAGFGCRPAPSASPRQSARLDPGWFEDATSGSGLAFVHDSGATGSYFMPESIGSGGALLDYDQDGRLDVYLVQCVPPGSGSRNRLFHQEADGRFRDVSEGSGLDVTGYGMGVAVGDVNNDGWPDVLLTEYGAARLFVNRGGRRFEDVAGTAGLDNTRWATSAAFFDYDRDGWLDLVIANYVDYTPTQKCFDTRGAQEYCGPQGMAGTVTRLFRNLGRDASENVARSRGTLESKVGTHPAGQVPSEDAGPVRFEDVTVRSGLAQKTGPALGVFCADFDGDRWPDIFVADDGQPNRLFMNQRNGTFVEEAALRGVAYNALGATAANMGIAAGDINNDGLFDLFVTHLNWEQHALWRQGPRGLFQDQTAAAGLANPSWRATGFGTVFADFDQDGLQDLAFVNGSIRRGQESGPWLEKLDSFWTPYAQRNHLFAGTSNGVFREISMANPAFCRRAGVGRGLACGDLDNDGDVDLLALSAGGPARLLRNVAPAPGHWLTVRAVDPALGGRDAYGAEITIEAGGHRWWRLVQPGYSYLVSNDPRVHFGLGSIGLVDRVQVVWPDGSEETFPGGPVNRRRVLRKGEGNKR